MQNVKTPKHRQALVWTAPRSANEDLSLTIAVPANSQPQAAAKILKKCFSPEWWVEFVAACLDEEIGDYPKAPVRK